MNKKPVTRLDYCQYLVVSQINYTLTNFADHSEQFSHDAINRYLSQERLTPDWYGTTLRAKLGKPQMVIWSLTIRC